MPPTTTATSRSRSRMLTVFIAFIAKPFQERLAVGRRRE
jgi:hypothetical protein